VSLCVSLLICIPESDDWCEYMYYPTVLFKEIWHGSSQNQMSVWAYVCLPSLYSLLFSNVCVSLCVCLLICIKESDGWVETSCSCIFLIWFCMWKPFYVSYNLYFCFTRYFHPHLSPYASAVSLTISSLARSSLTRTCSKMPAAKVCQGNKITVLVLCIFVWWRWPKLLGVLCIMIGTNPTWLAKFDLS
jgi:hypothetical protein